MFQVLFFFFRLYLLTLSSILIVLSYTFMLILETPYLSLIFLGLSYSLFGAIIWPTVSYIVRPNFLVKMNIFYFYYFKFIIKGISLGLITCI